jgi:hypothetical protein
MNRKRLLISLRCLVAWKMGFVTCYRGSCAAPCLHTSASCFLVLRVSVQNTGHIALLREERTLVMSVSPSMQMTELYFD